MKRNIKNTLYSGLAIASAFATMVSCTDTWDEHYASSGTSATNTLMQTIEKNAPDFAKVIKAVKFDREMSSDNSFTVWAPLTLNTDSLLELAAKDSAAVVDGFIKNHMARYTIAMDGTEKNVNLINNKFSLFNSKQFSSSALVADKVNIQCTNGVLHMIDKANPYHLNLFELIKKQYMDSDYSEKDEVGGSLYTFLRKYDADSLDQDKSVSRGYDAYGEQIWVDSVVIRNNTVLKNVYALIYEEDSNYIAILPSPKAYHERFKEYKNLLKFNETLNENIAVDGIDRCDSLANHYANMFAMNDLFYNVSENEHMEDSLKSTTYGTYSLRTDVYYRKDKKGQFSPTHDILAGLTPTQCSNGTAYLVDEYPMSTFEQANYQLAFPLSPYYLVKDVDKKGNAYTSNIDTDINVRDAIMQGSYRDYAKKQVEYTDEEGNTYYKYEDDSTKYEVRQYFYYNYELVNKSRQTYLTYFIPDVLAGTYDIKLVTIPYWAKYGFDGAEVTGSPYSFRVNIYERDSKGVYPTQAATSTSFENKTATVDPKQPKYFTSNMNARVDTTYLGEYTFKNTYYRRGYSEETCGAMIQILPKTKTQMLLSYIIFTPKESKKEDSEK